jgi:hypothetical protein
LNNTKFSIAIFAQLRFHFYLIEISAIYEGGESKGDSFANLLLVAQPQLPKYTRYPVSERYEVCFTYETAAAALT